MPMDEDAEQRGQGVPGQEALVAAMSSPVLEAAAALLCRGREDHSTLLIHEAACAAYGIDLEAFPLALDVLTERTDLPAAVGGVPVRVWRELPGYGTSWARHFEALGLWNTTYGVWALRPEFVLSNMSWSPDVDAMVETTGFLAAILMADVASDEQIERCVRCIRAI